MFPRKSVAAMAVAAIVYSSAALAGVGSGSARPVSLSLSSFNVAPRLLHLKAGQPILLRIANESAMSHDLTAPEFFDESSIAPADSATIVRGRVALGGQENVTLRLTPRPGRYAIKCSHRWHKLLGMSGTIVVD